jgi:hypothetical protein
VGLAPNVVATGLGKTARERNTVDQAVGNG